MASASSNTSPTLSLLSYNAGLLRLRLFWFDPFTLFSNPPFVRERFGHLPKALLSSGADIIALQEVYEDIHVDGLLAAVREVYPYHARGDARRSGLQFHNGLLILSKLQIDQHELIVHAQSAGVERTLASKSMLAVKLGTPLGELCIINMHTTAGGGRDPESAMVDKVRDAELREAMDYCSIASEQGFRCIIAGDLNMGEEASASNYQSMLDAGYRDGVKEAHSRQPHLTSMLPMTWDPANPLNAVGPHASQCAQRIDHIMLHPQSGLAGEDTELRFTEKDVELPGRQENCTISDHYGLNLKIAIAPPSTDAASAGHPDQTYNPHHLATSGSERGSEINEPRM